MGMFAGFLLSLADFVAVAGGSRYIFPSQQKPIIRFFSQIYRGIGRYDPGDLTEAYQAVLEDGISVEKAAKMFAVPITTLKDRVMGRVDIDVLRSGPHTLFTLDQEAFLASHLQTMAEVGYGYSRQETLNLASDYAVHLGIKQKAQTLGFDCKRMLDSLLAGATPGAAGTSKQCTDVTDVSFAVPGTSGLQVKRKQPPVEEVVSSDSVDSDIAESE
ncbi:hypothetical protein DPMN_009871 [Dreissena polymorpha]|uniref:HTH psq-type domain-containing protein n=1 Tax=Dreissena polymorpha TaxID=45954 RepID=A0A9D4MXS0_DREPO|nr:hypothetical protein DPMN_009871 [Dreissena polymorpha]